MPMLTDFDKFIVGVVMMVIILSLSWLYLKHDDYKKDIEDHKNKKLKNF